MDQQATTLVVQSERYVPARPPSPPRRQRACQTCSKGKARCIFQEENIGKTCDRCLKLGLECVQQPIAFRRRPFRLAQTESPPVTPIQQSHDAGGIASTSDDQGREPHPPAASSSNGYPSGSAGRHALPSPIPKAYGGDHTRHSPSGHFPEISRGPQQNYAPSTNAATSRLEVAQRPLPLSPGYGLSWEEASLAVTEFKSHYMPLFPFVLLDPGTTAQCLYNSSPFVFRAVMLTAARLSITRRKTLKRNVMAYLGQHLLVGEERSLDLLQGLLVVITWSETAFYLDRSITHLINLAVGYAYNLGLTKTPPLHVRHKFRNVQFNLPYNGTERGMGMPAEEETARPSHDPERVHKFDEQRALLGCYYLASVNAAQFGRKNTFRPAAVDTCAENIRVALDRTSETDTLMLKMIHLQRTIDKLGESLDTAQEFEDRHQATTTFASFVAELVPLEACLKEIAGPADDPGAVYRCWKFMYENQLQHGGDSDSSYMSFCRTQTRTFSLHHQYVRVRLYEPAIALATDRRQPMMPGLIQQGDQCDLWKYLDLCLDAAKGFFSILLDFPPEMHLHNPFATAAELIAVITASARLLLLDSPGWDLDHARDMLQFPSILDGLVNRFTLAGEMCKQRGADSRAAGAADQSANGERDAEDPRGSFGRYIEKMLWIKKWYLTRVAGDTSPAITAGEVQALGTSFNALESQSNQFWLGLLGNAVWDIKF